MKRQQEHVRGWHRLSLIVLPLLTVAFILLFPTTTHASATSVTTMNTAPFSVVVFVPCAAGGVGELVDLSGTFHFLSHVTFDDGGGFHDSIHEDLQAVSGIGETSGDRYQATGAMNDDTSLTDGGTFAATFINNLRIVGQEPGNNFLIQENMHITVNPVDFMPSSFHDTFSVSCQ
jgi:hypothetical protein